METNSLSCEYSPLQDKSTYDIVAWDGIEHVVKRSVRGDAPTYEAGGKIYVIIAGDIAKVNYDDLVSRD